MEIKLFAFLLMFWNTLFTINAGDDYYTLLGIDKGASVKEIRKAFKKLAITKHPDKNVDDPEAHDVFIKINRAYEVLKDEDLRKKYDQYGEEGLKDDFQRGRRYESWQWYQQNFGIYDDDPEIITLSRTDFEQSVEGSGELWFINFYSPHCSHCHELAPTWRELARELENVIRIGAVNCEDDWQLCRMQNIHSYPSLVFYPAKEKYQGQRTTETLVKEALKRVKSDYHRLTANNFNKLINSDLPWLITFCGDGGDCLEKKSCLKLAAMLVDLVNVGKIACDTDVEICTKLGQHHGTFYYKEGKVMIGNGMEISSLDPKEVAKTVLQHLPDVELISEDFLKEIKEKRNQTWLIHFVDKADNQDLELRKLPALLKNYKVGRVNCAAVKWICLKLYVSKFPTFMLFKANGGTEVYYGGRITAHDVAAFVRDSAETPLENLSPEDFPDRVVNSKEPWFVDFFAPWCPPCMRLLPEFKKASKLYGLKVNFGTVDCTVHNNLCNMNHIHSYPTTILYNQSIPHQYHGHHSVKHLLEFIDDTMKPPVISLDKQTFEKKVINRPEDEFWLVDFFAPWCGPCQQLTPEWRRLAKKFLDKSNIYVAKVDCVAHQDLCHSQNVHSYPSIRMYPARTSRSPHYHTYNGWQRDVTSLEAWVYNYLPSKVVALTTSTFTQTVLDSKVPWIIDYYTPWCGHCQVFKPHFESVAEKLDGVAHAGKVDCESESSICSQAGITAYPSVRFYVGAKSNKRQSAHGWSIESQNVDFIVQYVKSNVPKTKRIDDEL
ncbi:DnaJ sub C member 10 [Bulinus truncatus]|nr:DnaJ sub C member 10 [Bulinus truncatus]